MEIDDVKIRFHLRQNVVTGTERAIQRIHKHLALDVDDAETPIASVQQIISISVTAFRIVGWTDQIGMFVQVFLNFPAFENVVSGSDDVNSTVEKEIGGMRQNTISHRGIFPVCDYSVYLIFSFKRGQLFPQKIAPLLADDVSN